MKPHLIMLRSSEGLGYCGPLDEHIVKFVRQESRVRYDWVRLCSWPVAR